MSEERETEFVTGLVDSIITKGQDKWQASVIPGGSQYSKKLWFKGIDTFNAITQLIGSTATFECNVSHWNKDDGTPVKSLWVAAVNPGTPPPQSLTIPSGSNAAATASEPPRDTPAPVRTQHTDPTRVSIERQTAVKAAVEFHRGTEAGEDDVLRLARRLADFMAAVNDDSAPF